MIGKEDELKILINTVFTMYLRVFILSILVHTSLDDNFTVWIIKTMGSMAINCLTAFEELISLNL